MANFSSNRFIRAKFDPNEFVANTYLQGYLTDNFISNNYVSDVFTSNNYVIGTYVSNTYATDTLASNSYSKDTFTSNSYVQDRYVSNNYLDTTLDSFSSNTYLQDTFASNTYVVSILSIFSSNTYLQDQLDLKATNTYVNSTFTSNNYVDGKFTSNNYVSTRVGLRATNTYVNSTFSSNNYLQDQLDLKATNTYVNSTFTSNNYIDGKFTSNTFLADTFTTNNYVDGRFASNTYVISKYASNTYVSSKLGLRATNTYVNSTFTSNNYIDGKFVSNNYAEGRFASNNYIGDNFTSNTFLVATFASNNYVQDHVATEVAAIVNSAPAALDTLNELAAALGDDSNFSTTVSNQIGLRATNTYVNSTFTSNNYLQGQLSTKLNSSSYTASDVLTKIKTVDGSGSGLDADLLGGISSASFLRSDTSDSFTSGTLSFSSGADLQGGLQSKLGGFYTPQNPEGIHLRGHTFFNDIAYARLRGSTISVDVDGTPMTSTTNIDKMLSPTSDFWNVSTSGVTTVTITITSIPANIRFSSYMGVNFGNTNWRAKDITLEYSTDNGLTYSNSGTFTDQGDEFVISSLGLGATPANALRWTLEDFNTTSMRINGLFAYDFNSPGMTGLYLPLGGGTVYGDIGVDGTVDGRDVAADGSKLDGIESGATADQTASEILTAIKTVDGAGSGLDADTLDGLQGSSYSSNNYITDHYTSNNYLQGLGFTTNVGDVTNTYLTATFTTNNYVGDIYLSNNYFQSVPSVSNNYLQSQLSSTDTALVTEHTGNGANSISIDLTGLVGSEVFVNGLRLPPSDFVANVSSNTVSLELTLESSDHVTLVRQFGIYNYATDDLAGMVSNNYVRGIFTSNNYATAALSSNSFVKSTFTANNYVQNRYTSNNYMSSGTTLQIKDSSGSTVKTIKSVP